MGRHLLEGGVHVGLVTVRPGDARSQIVADHDLVASPHEFEGVGVRGHPVQELLGGEGLGVEVVRRPGDGDEQLGVECHLAGSLVIDGDRLAREVDEELLARPVLLAHDDVDLSPKGPIQVGELAVAVTVGMVLAVLEPEQLQGHALSPQLDVDVLPVWSGPDDPLRHDWREQQLLERVVVELVGERPGQARRDSTHDVVGHGGDGKAERGTHLAAAELFPEAQPEDISDLAHGDTGSGQLLLLESPTVIMTNGRRPTAKSVIERYASRMTIEQPLGEAIRSFHLDALSSTVPLNVDLDVVLSVLAGATCASLRRRLTGYHHATPDTI